MTAPEVPAELPADRSLPPGQRLVGALPVMHYGPVPKRRPERWDLRVGGATASGAEHVLGWDDVAALPRLEVVADLHCASRWSVLDQSWSGHAASALVELAPPRSDVAEVLVFAEFGYAAVVALEDLVSGRAVLATHLDGEVLDDAHGGPLRLVIPHLYSWKGPKWLRGWTYLTEPERGFWEARGYHRRGDAWREERYAYQE
ncbi:oxidoreductase molybdopterin binding [Beutenbergia cavernae DSM 12333]|uniref:Oxidoreductase molybdopterin binding n=1 Tax=Beutenbergia cavernae (strain ATCC BAA-8 / DSM 12333 / CCUG 43141 / JCM 11478 / NBRC 16432 / NCIMB 13614 / HKI 0122) TaxID=471853 RepID=C5C5H2_BEUC1|nr:molybdopterin-dependent oxidoreductase [Beutenbergia cavernae]ACQ80163.1 oxidoreductase molybdopterin binding [Beutenbergia cavernae DSM 12333]